MRSKKSREEPDAGWNAHFQGESSILPYAGPQDDSNVPSRSKRRKSKRTRSTHTVSQIGTSQAAAPGEAVNGNTSLVKRLLSRSSKRQDSDTEAESSSIAKIKKGSYKVAIVDDTHTIYATINRFTLRNIKINEHGDIDDALTHALKFVRRGNATLIWAGEHALRSLGAPTEDIHPSLVDIDAAERLASVFSDERLSSAVQTTALSPTNTDAIARLLKTPTTMSGFAVGMEDGAWIRIGYNHTSATLVNEGEIVAYRKLGSGMDAARQALRHDSSYDPSAMLRTFASTIAEALHEALTDWQGSHPSVRLIWLYGPGNDRGGVVSSIIRDDTQTRVKIPIIPELRIPPEISELSDLPTLFYGINSPKLILPSKVLKQPAIKKRRRLLATGATIALTMVAMWVYSHNQGRAIASRTEEATQRTLAAQIAVDLQLNALVTEALAAQEILPTEPQPEAIDVESDEPQLTYPRWNLLMEFADGDTIASSRCATIALIHDAVGFAGYVDEIEKLDLWAERIYGNGSYALGGLGISINPDDNTTGGSVTIGLLGDLCDET